MQVQDKDENGNEKFMGATTASIVDWVGLGKWEGDLELTDKSGKGVGGVNLTVTFQRPGAVARQAADASKAQAGAPGGKGPAASMTMGPAGRGGGAEPSRDPNGKFTDEEIYEAFVSFDLDKNNFVGAAEIRHVLINIGETVTDEEVRASPRGDSPCSCTERGAEKLSVLCV